MAEPKVAKNGPFVMDMKAGNYAWCACGHSETQPFCDGSHQVAGEFVPMLVTIEEDKKVAWCGCKHSNNKPFCDAAHTKL